MRHRKAGFKLGRNTSHRRAMLRNLVTSILLEDRVHTTITKAKAARPTVEKMITLGKRGDLHARRQALAYLQTREAVSMPESWRRGPSRTGPCSTRAAIHQDRSPRCSIPCRSSTRSRLRSAACPRGRSPSPRDCRVRCPAGPSLVVTP